MGLERYTGIQKMGRPEKVERARLAGDHEALSRMGKAGNLAKSEKTEAARIIASHNQETKDAEARFRAEQAGELVGDFPLPPDNID